MYRSKYPHTIPPTGSTFCHKTTSKPGVNHVRSRSRIYRDNLKWDFKLIQNMVTNQPWAILNMIARAVLIVLQKNTRAQWAIMLFLLFVIFHTTASIKKSRCPERVKNLCLGKNLIKISSLPMQSKTFYLVHEDKRNLSTGWIKKIMVKCLSTFQRLRKILKSSIR